MPQLHILQHKSWHVYNQENRDKVSRDEEKARKEEEEKEEKMLRAESEHRLALLRKKAQERLQAASGAQVTDSNPAITASLSTNATSTVQTEATNENEEYIANQSTALVVSSPQPKLEHINFWADYEKKIKATNQGNPEYEADKRKEQDKWDRQITKYLGDVVKGKDPWYARETISSDTVEHYDGSQKVRQDPLSSINKYVAKKKSDKERHELELLKQSIKKERLLKKSPESVDRKRERESERKSSKEKKSKHKHKHSSKSSSKSEKPPIFSPEIQKLREEWYEKEKQRREHAEKLIEYEKSNRPRGRYYSQYNPREERSSRHRESSSSRSSTTRR